MTAKDKADELIRWFLDNTTISRDHRYKEQISECAIKCLDEQILTLKELCAKFDNNSDESWWYISEVEQKIEFLEEVKQEIDKL